MTFSSSISNYTPKLARTHSEDQTHHCDLTLFSSEEKQSFIAAKMVFKSYRIGKRWSFWCCSVVQLFLTLCDPMDCSMSGFPVHHQLPEFIQTHVHWVGDTILPSRPLSSPSPPALNLSQHQGLFQWTGSSHQVAKVSELQLEHQSFQWIFRVDLF